MYITVLSIDTLQNVIAHPETAQVPISLIRDSRKNIYVCLHSIHLGEMHCLDISVVDHSRYVQKIENTILIHSAIHS